MRRRRLERFIPIVLLALLAQLIAPLGAFRAVAQAVSDPLHMSEICSHLSSDDGQSLPSGGSAAHDDCCVACGAGLGGAAILNPPPLIFVVLHQEYQRVVWLEASTSLPAIRTGSNAQARAPPAFS